MLPNDIDALKNYFSLMNSNGVARVFHTARDVGILAAILNTELSVDEVCLQCRTHPRGTELVLETLVQVGVAQSEEGRYRTTPLANMLLNSSYQNLGDTYWDHLESFLREGNPIATMDLAEHSEQHYQQQAAGLAWMMAPSAKAAAHILLSDGSRKGLSILDVGAGAAPWSLAVAAASPETKIVAIDWPAVLEVATRSAMQYGLEGQLTCLPGNYHEVTFEKECFDLVILANVTHLETEEQNLHLFRRLFQSVKPGGEFAIIDALPDGGSSDRTTHSLYALGLALRTEHGQVHSRRTLESAIAQAGFATPRYHPLAVPPRMMGILIAKKQVAP